MSIELYNDGEHKCIIFRHLVEGEAMQANQVLVYDHEHAALLDPGGELTYTRLVMGIGKYMNIRTLDYVVASHQDPDIVASLNKWLVGTDCKIVVPELWERFIPHFTRPGKLENRMVSIPDKGMALALGGIKLLALPAHFSTRKEIFTFTTQRARSFFLATWGQTCVRLKIWTNRPNA